MKQIKCKNKGLKLAQIPSCECTTFELFLDKGNNIVAKCTTCKTIYNNINCLKESFK